MGIICSKCSAAEVVEYRVTKCGLSLCYPCYNKVRYARSQAVPEEVLAARRKTRKDSERRYREKNRAELNRKAALVMSLKRKHFPEKVAEEKRKHYLANREKIIARNRALRLRNKEKLSKEKWQELTAAKETRIRKEEASLPKQMTGLAEVFARDGFLESWELTY